MKTRSNRIKESAQAEAEKPLVSNTVTFIMVLIGLTIVVIISLILKMPSIFFLSNISFVFAIVALPTGNKFLVSFSIAMISPYFVASIYDPLHFIGLALLIVVAFFHWKRMSPIGVIFIVGFCYVYAFAIVINFGEIARLYVIELAWLPVTLTATFALVILLKTYGNLPSWL